MCILFTLKYKILYLVSNRNHLFVFLNFIKLQLQYSSIYLKFGFEMNRKKGISSDDILLKYTNKIIRIAHNNNNNFSLVLFHIVISLYMYNMYKFIKSFILNYVNISNTFHVLI